MEVCINNLDNISQGGGGKNNSNKKETVFV